MGNLDVRSSHYKPQIRFYRMGTFLLKISYALLRYFGWDFVLDVTRGLTRVFSLPLLIDRHGVDCAEPNEWVAVREYFLAQK